MRSIVLAAILGTMAGIAVSVVLLTIVSSILSSLFGFGINPDHLIPKLRGLLCMAAGAIGVYKLNRALWHKSDQKKRGASGTFVASQSGIELPSGKKIETDQIHRLLIRNEFSNDVIPYAGGGLIVGGTGAMGAGASVGSAVGAALANSLAVAAQMDHQRNSAIGYKLDAEFAGNAETLAGGMTETTAFGLMQNVGKTLGLGS
jgi:hypothetical protein